MVRDIMRTPLFLMQLSEPAVATDREVADDLRDTLAAHADECVGMAANMIGVRKRIIIVNDAGKYLEMFNPVIVGKGGPYEAEEGCLSLPGVRKVMRYKNITVQWQTRDMKPQLSMFAGFTAQIIQHEVDHCNGVLI